MVKKMRWKYYTITNTVYNSEIYIHACLNCILYYILVHCTTFSENILVHLLHLDYEKINKEWLIQKMYFVAGVQ